MMPMNPNFAGVVNAWALALRILSLGEVDESGCDQR